MYFRDTSVLIVRPVGQKRLNTPDFQPISLRQRLYLYIILILNIFFSALVGLTGANLYEEYENPHQNSTRS